MDLKQFILKTIKGLKDQGGSKAVVEYFKPWLKDVSIHKINAWIKTGKYPFEIADAVFANELEEHVEAPPNGEVTAAPTEEEEINLPPGTAFDEGAMPPGAIETTDAGVVPGVFPSDYPIAGQPPMAAPRVTGKRAADIKVVTGKAPSMFGGPETVAPTVDAEEVARMAAILQALGFQIPAQRAAAPPAAPVARPPARVAAAPPGARTRVVGRNWNDPQASASATKPPP